jgi:hypothetical protein
MSRISISLDGCTVGQNQTRDAPFGDGGMGLPQSQFDVDKRGREGDAAILAGSTDGVGAYIVGRNMFRLGRDEWDESLTGWWGPNPPYHTPARRQA